MPEPSPKPVMLVILDGWGWRDDQTDNAIRLARTPHFSQLWERCPHGFLSTCGEDVGLPEGQFGNSEVGHLNIGAGRVVMQDLPRINRTIREHSLGAVPAFRALVSALQATGGACHLLGLISPGGVHAHQNHALALARLLCEAGLAVHVHVFTDGRDTPPQSGRDYVREFEQALPQGAHIATVCGRYFALDRDNRWERVSQAYAAMAEGQGAQFGSADAVIAAAYEGGVTDEFIKPAVIGDFAGMKDGDALLSFNFRADRIREILAALVQPDFNDFARPRAIHFAAAVSMTRYSDALAPLVREIFAPVPLTRILGDVVASAGKRQLRMAETEKYPHVTYFLNGGAETPFAQEDRILVPSPKVATYDLQPEMSAPELTDRAVQAIEAGGYDLIVLNYANPDMVGHTGDLQAAIRAVETVDTGLGRIAKAVQAAGGALLVTADHGNCEMMRDPETGVPHTAHTTNRVPVLLMGGGAQHLQDGRLADLAPTLLQLMGLAQPAEMTGRSLIGP